MSAGASISAVFGRRSTLHANLDSQPIGCMAVPLRRKIFIPSPTIVFSSLDYIDTSGIASSFMGLPFEKKQVMAHGQFLTSRRVELSTRSHSKWEPQQMVVALEKWNAIAVQPERDMYSILPINDWYPVVIFPLATRSLFLSFWSISNGADKQILFLHSSRFFRSHPEPTSPLSLKMTNVCWYRSENSYAETVQRLRQAVVTQHRDNRQLKLLTIAHRCQFCADTMRRETSHVWNRDVW